MMTTKTHTYSDAEWQARVDLAAAYRLTDHFGMTTLIYNHITALVPGTDDQFLIPNPPMDGVRTAEGG